MTKDLVPMLEGVEPKAVNTDEFFLEIKTRLNQMMV